MHAHANLYACPKECVVIHRIRWTDWGCVSSDTDWWIDCQHTVLWMTNCQRRACQRVCVQTGKWCHMSIRGADDLEREEEVKKTRVWEMLTALGQFVLRRGSGWMGGAFLWPLPPRISSTQPSLPVPLTQLHGALTQQHNEQGLAWGRRSKVFPVTWTAASTKTCMSGTTLAWVSRPDFTPSSFN